MARQEIDRDATVLERMMGGDGVGSRHGKCHRLSRDDAEAELYQVRQPIRELWAAGSSKQTVQGPCGGQSLGSPRTSWGFSRKEEMPEEVVISAFGLGSVAGAQMNMETPGRRMVQFEET